jgi:glycosyltransferase involved in cell wall biosynthesis
MNCHLGREQVVVKILHVLCQKPDSTGSGIYLRALLKEAKKAGHTSACVVGLNPEDSPRLEKIYPVVFDSAKLPFSIVGMSDVMPYRSTLWSDMSEERLKQYDTAFSSVLKLAVAVFRPDTIHCHHLWYLTALTRRLFPKHRIVTSCHGTGLRQAQKLPEFAATFEQDLQTLDHVYALTEKQAEQISLPPERVSVVGAGFNSEAFHSEGRPSNEKTRVLYAGKISRSKGCAELLEAFEPLAEEGLEMTFAGSGQGDEAEVLKERARSLDVTLMGRLTQQEIADEMRRTDVFVLPSYYEGLPLVLAEALASGCRVVVTSLEGISDWLPDELISQGWVKVVPLPNLVDTDKPVEEEIPEFVVRLREAIREQAKNGTPVPDSLADFLKRNSWSEVYSHIQAQYE